MCSCISKQINHFELNVHKICHYFQLFNPESIDKNFRSKINIENAYILNIFYINIETNKKRFLCDTIFPKIQEF